MKLEKIEQETILLYNNAEKEANVYSCNEDVKKQVRQLAKDFPEQVKIKRDDEITIDAVVPKKWIKIVPPRKLSDEQRKAAAERMKSVRLKRKEK